MSAGVQPVLLPLPLPFRTCCRAGSSPRAPQVLSSFPLPRHCCAGGRKKYIQVQQKLQPPPKPRSPSPAPLPRPSPGHRNTQGGWNVSREAPQLPGQSVPGPISSSSPVSGLLLALSSHPEPNPAPVLATWVPFYALQTLHTMRSCPDRSFQC